MQETVSYVAAYAGTKAAIALPNEASDAKKVSKIPAVTTFYKAELVVIQRAQAFADYETTETFHAKNTASFVQAVSTGDAFAEEKLERNEISSIFVMSHRDLVSLKLVFLEVPVLEDGTLNF